MNLFDESFDFSNIDLFEDIDFNNEENVYNSSRDCNLLIIELPEELPEEKEDINNNQDEKIFDLEG
jgi:hypothetical protein